VRNLFLFPTNRILTHSTAIASSYYPRGGKVKDCGVLHGRHDVFDAKAWCKEWEHDPTSDAGIDLCGDDDARKLMRPLCMTGAPKYAALWTICTNSFSRHRPQARHGTLPRMSCAQYASRFPIQHWRSCTSRSPLSLPHTASTGKVKYYILQFKTRRDVLMRARKANGILPVFA
jgi:hypothetical protein